MVGAFKAEVSPASRARLCGCASPRASAHSKSMNPLRHIPHCSQEKHIKETQKVVSRMVGVGFEVESKIPEHFGEFEGQGGFSPGRRSASLSSLPVFCSADLSSDNSS